jgi:hypothetical protein
MNQQANAKREFPYVTLILAVALLLVVVILGYTFVDSIGLIGRLDTAAKSDTIKLNEQELDVYRFHVAQNQLYTQYMYIQYGMMQDPTGGYITQGLMDVGTFINYMLPSMVGSSSLDASAYAYAEQYLTYCEAAKAEGVYDAYKAEIEADIDEYLENLKTTAESIGITLGNYLKNYVGTGVSKGDVKSAMEYYYIGGKYAEKLYDDFSDAVTLEQIEKYREDNKASFYTTSYTYYKLLNNDVKEAIEKCTTVDEVKVAIVNYMVNTKFTALYKTNITDKKIEADEAQTKADVLTTVLAMNNLTEDKAVFTSTDTDDYKKAAFTIANSISTSAKAEMTASKIVETKSAWADPKGASATDLQKWLFGDAGRKKGDTTVIETKSEKTDSTTGKTTTTYSYTWYIIGEDVMKLDEEKTKNAYYIMLTDDAKDAENAKTAAEKAEAFYNALKDNKTAEKFAELAEEYAPGYSTELIEKISYESIKSSNEDLAKWLFDNRTKGDITNIVVKGDSKDKDKVTGHIIAVYEDENEETWKMNGRDAIANEELEKWYDEAVKKYNVVIDYEPETTAPSTTKAPEATKEPATKAPEAATKEPATEAGTEAATEAGTEAQGE